MTRGAREGLLPFFFLSGFECSTFVWGDRGRRDLAEETQHRAKAVEDYRLLRTLGLGVAREGIPWPFVDRGDGRYDFSPIEPYLAAMDETGITPIWDLCHYGYPDDLDPADPGFVRRFADYCRAAAEHVIPRVTSKAPNLFTAINEITYFAQAGGDWAFFAPFWRGAEGRERLRLILCEAAIAGIRAIRDVDPGARFVAMDPIVNVVAPRDRPDLAPAAAHETYVDTFVAWDILAGLQHPELAGAPDVLDIVGVNCYSFGQMELRGRGPHAPLEPGDDRILPLADLLTFASNRYGRPVIVAESSGLRDGRRFWFRDLMGEALEAIDRGVDLQGVCLFPAVDMPDWRTGEWVHNGIADVVPNGEDLVRVPDPGYVEEIRAWQHRLERAETVDDDPFSDPVDLGQVQDAAHRMVTEADPDWS